MVSKIRQSGERERETQTQRSSAGRKLFTVFSTPGNAVGWISFLRRVGSCKTSATLRPETCDAPFPRRRLLLSPPLRREWLEDRFLWGFALLGVDPEADAVRRFSPQWSGRSLPTFPHGSPRLTLPPPARCVTGAAAFGWELERQPG